MRLRIGTRGSRLALVQGEAVAGVLRAHGAEVEVVTIKTSGDRLGQVALADFGGKALFVSEIEEALREGRVDVGVHSLKDMPAAPPAGLTLAAFPAREDPRDALLTRAGEGLDVLPAEAVVGTSSLRRRVLLRSRRPDLRVEPIRGNVETRMGKLRDGLYDGLVMAAAGLNRLGLTWPQATLLDADDFVPAVGQGILGVEARQADREVLELLRALDDTRTRMQAEAERAFLVRLGAGCHTAVAGYARLEGEALTLTGLVASPDGAKVLKSAVSGPATAAEQLGFKLADELLARGARLLLEAGHE